MDLTQPRIGWIGITNYIFMQAFTGADSRVGLGNMGAAMAKNMQRDLAANISPPLVVFNRTASRMEPVIALGAIASQSESQLVAESGIIFISVSFCWFCGSAQSHACPDMPIPTRCAQALIE